MSRFQTKNLFEDLDNAPDGCDSNSAQLGHIIRVAVDSAADQTFDYLVDDSLWPLQPGQRVLVPFGKSNKNINAFCIDIVKNSTAAKTGKTFRLKKIKAVTDDKPLLNPDLLELAQWISRYYVCPLGQVLAAMVPAAVKKGAGVQTQRFIYLENDFQTLAEKIKSKKQKQLLEYLQQQNANSPETAVEEKAILAAINSSTRSPVTQLSAKTIIKVIAKTALKSLPAIPAAFAPESRKVVLNDDQKNALQKIDESLKSSTFGVSLLHGVTDSGKTEVYIRAIETAIACGKSAIVLLPEIALTTQTIDRFNSRFDRLAVMHSGLTAAQRNQQWQKIKTGDADVVIGARSAIFAPLNNLGLVVVDEEHEPCYKQDTTPRYHARDVAIKRAQLASGHCILGSATPSLETIANCTSKKHFQLLSLPKRVMDLPMPAMQLVDMKNEYSEKKGPKLISDKLRQSLDATLAKNEQAILLLNRRGYSSFIFCPSCKHTLSCRNCDVSLTFHKSPSKTSSLQSLIGKHIHCGFATCHYCLAKTLVPEKCPVCGKPMTMFGLGSQRLEEELKEKFPHAKIARVDSDSMQDGNYYKLLSDFSSGKIDILAGTQMIAKGLHFPNVTTVGIISADTSLYLPDFRANERTFQLISQVAGRTGRSEKKGIVLVQTFLGEQPSIKFALKNDFQGFVAEELKHRKACNLPPFWRMAVILLQDTDYDKLELAAKLTKEKIDAIIAENRLTLHIRGPMPPAISRMNRYHRSQIIIQSPDAETISRFFAILRACRPIKPAVKVAIDIDPVNLL